MNINNKQTEKLDNYESFAEYLAQKIDDISSDYGINIQKLREDIDDVVDAAEAVEQDFSNANLGTFNATLRLQAAIDETAINNDLSDEAKENHLIEYIKNQKTQILDELAEGVAETQNLRNSSNPK